MAPLPAVLVELVVVVEIAEIGCVAVPGWAVVVVAALLTAPRVVSEIGDVLRG